MPPTDESSIPAFRVDGYLPEGLFPATLAEVTFRFGTSSRRRRFLTLRLRRWTELARHTGAERMFVDGSFVTAKEHLTILTRLFCSRAIFTIKLVMRALMH